MQIHADRQAALVQESDAVRSVVVGLRWRKRNRMPFVGIGAGEMGLRATGTGQPSPVEHAE